MKVEKKDGALHMELTAFQFNYFRETRTMFAEVQPDLFDGDMDGIKEMVITCAGEKIICVCAVEMRGVNKVELSIIRLKQNENAVLHFQREFTNAQLAVIEAVVMQLQSAADVDLIKQWFPAIAVRIDEIKFAARALHRNVRYAEYDVAEMLRQQFDNQPIAEWPNIVHSVINNFINEKEKP